MIKESACRYFVVNRGNKNKQAILAAIERMACSRGVDYEEALLHIAEEFFYAVFVYDDFFIGVFPRFRIFDGLNHAHVILSSAYVGGTLGNPCVF